MILHTIKKENNCMKILGWPHSSSNRGMTGTSSEKRLRQLQGACKETEAHAVGCKLVEACISDSYHFWRSCNTSVERVLDTSQLHVSDEAGAETVSVLKWTLDPVKDHLLLLRHSDKHHCINQSHLIDLTKNGV